jgi:putative ABC transport system permease protein
VLVTGPGAGSTALQAVVRRDLPGGTVALRATAQNALAREPLPRDESMAVTAAEAAAAALTLLVLLIMIADAAWARRSTAAGLRVMGASTRQARWAELAETLPLVVATAAGGVACAWALGPLIGPALNLSALTGGTTVPVGARWAPLGAAAAGLLILTLLAMAVQARAGRNEESRIGEEPG